MQRGSLVSFLIISYEHKQFIADCFESILAQTYMEIEILYLDDASNDGTFEKACEYKERFLERFPNVVFIENESNLGLVKSLNKLIGLCRGEYVKFLAADDFLFADSIENLVDFMEEYLQHDMVYSNGVVGDKDTHFPISDVSNFGYVYERSQPSGRMLFNALYNRDFISAPGVMVRKTVYDKVGLYDESIGVEDWDFYLRIAREGSIGYLEEMTVMYRILENSLSHSSDIKRRMNMKKSELQIIEKYKDVTPQYAKKRMETSLNEALQDAFHIGNREYLSYLYLYAKTNNVRINIRNLFKQVLYKFGVIKLYDSLFH